MDHSLSRRVFDQLYEAMLDHRLRPRDRLNRRQVAQDLGVSVAPVLEAMMRLEWEGYLQTSPRLGTVVREVTVADVAGQFRLRQAIEVEAVRISAGERLRAAAATLGKLAIEADAAASETRANYRTEVAFHSALVEVAACPHLSRAHAQVMRHGLYHAAHDLLPALPRRTKDLHARLLAALLRADADQAATLIRRHLATWFDVLAKACDAKAPGPVAFRGPAVSLKRSRRGGAGKS